MTLNLMAAILRRHLRAEPLPPELPLQQGVRHFCQLWRQYEFLQEAGHLNTI